jgi:hypothetical protein
VLPDQSKDHLCNHLQPVLDDFLANGARVVRCDLDLPGVRANVVIDKFINKDEVSSAFDISESVLWSWADPHYGTGNSLICKRCRAALEGHFEIRDPQGTLGH